MENFNDTGVRLDISYSEEELKLIEAENYKKCVEIVDILLAHGAYIDLFGVDGMQPLTCAYYSYSIDMVKYLLEKGANPNYNSYRSDDVSCRSNDSHRCTILYVIDDLLHEDSVDYDKSVAVLIRNYGGRTYEWDAAIPRLDVCP